MKSRLIYLAIKVLNIIIRGSIPWLKDIEAEYGYKCIIAKHKKSGASIGDNTLLINCTLSSSSKGDKFIIGRNCTLTGVTLLAHDASPTLFLPELINREFSYLPKSRNSYRKTIKIGDNVFIGWNSIVLPGVKVGSNVVIGAGSVVCKDIPDNVVVAGNPAKIIKPLDDYIENYRRLYERHPERF
ncbi:acyltransferase [Catenovulum sp. SM1970]|uniref:acyltransferase n=1 Tax=Marinifaba aquimaris TaxID=2741323 RepID=UPI0015739345|nr:DapH/DapD/GlmU-related protein [Marinifaba aquimaris]NTS76900.1 acyltransferase [Marinifaba aquimaris]